MAEAAGAVIMEASLERVDEFFRISWRMGRLALQSAVGGMLLHPHGEAPERIGDAVAAWPDVEFGDSPGPYRPRRPSPRRGPPGRWLSDFVRGLAHFMRER